VFTSALRVALAHDCERGLPALFPRASRQHQHALCGPRVLVNVTQHTTMMTKAGAYQWSRMRSLQAALSAATLHQPPSARHCLFVRAQARVRLANGLLLGVCGGGGRAY
jgi:hypothetical protein